MHKCTCPYCGKEMEDPDECYETDECYEHECPHCEKNFVFYVDYIRIYSEKKADCLNGAEHEYHPTRTYPREYTKMRCVHCDDTRACTDEEMEMIMNS